MKKRKEITLALGIVFLFIFLTIVLLIKRDSRQSISINSGMSCGKILSEENKRKKTITLEENEWEVEQDDKSAIGCNLHNSVLSTIGNGCTYTVDMGMYGGEKTEDGYSIYRLKEGKWELFVSHPITDEPWYVYETSVLNLTYFDGYIYYVLLRDSDPEMGSSGKDYSICRASEWDGGVEELAKCKGNFYIYRDEIYYKTLENGIRYFFKMKLDGSGKKLLFTDQPKNYSQYDYAVGGGCLYIKNESEIIGINLKTGKKKSFETNVKYVEGMFYEGGMLYSLDYNNRTVYQIDVKTGNEKKLIEDCCIWPAAVWICAGHLYYVEWENKSKELLYNFKEMNLVTGEEHAWDSISLEVHPVSVKLEIVQNHVIIRFTFSDRNAEGEEIHEHRYFEEEISEIIEKE